MSAALMLERGWVWEGLAFDPGLQPTVYGVGEGVQYFGLEGANFLFHENTETNFAKLSHVPRVTADISKWLWLPYQTDSGRWTYVHSREDSPEKVQAEAEKVGRLSLDFPNIVGGFIDDTHGVCAHDTYTPQTPAQIAEALRRHNAELDLWIVVYTHELEEGYWQDWRPHVDVINLWVWESKNLPAIEAYIARCRELFPDQRLVMGVYMRDYTLRAPVPLDLLQVELDVIAKHLEAGALDGYNILATCLIDQHPQQAELIREFIHRAPV